MVEGVEVVAVCVLNYRYVPGDDNGYETVDTSKLKPGSYRFYCQVHAFMRGTLVVR
jgi:plastocyanin